MSGLSGVSRPVLTPAEAAAAVQYKYGQPGIARPLVMLTIGNSIAAQGNFYNVAPRGFDRLSEIPPITQLLGPVFQWPLITPVAGVGGTSGAVDRCGNYGFNGSTLVTMRADILTTWFNALDAGVVTPDIVWLVACFENDIPAGRTVAQMQADTNTLLATLRAKWPQCKFLISTPRPNEQINTAPEIAAADGIRAWLLTLENTYIAVADISRATSNGDSWTPDYANILSSDVSPNRLHPNMAGVWRNARAALPALQRLVSGHIAGPSGVRSADYGVQAAAVAIDAPYTGTKPTGSSVFRSGGSAVASLVGAALLPGWQISVTDVAANSDGSHAGANLFLRQANITGTTLNSLQDKHLAAYAKVRIVSGAAGIGNVRASLTIAYSGGPANDAVATTGNTSNTIPAGIGGVYADGDLLWLLSPAIAPQTAAFGGAGTITAITNDVVFTSKNTAPFVLHVLEIGVVAYGQAPRSFAQNA